MRQKLLLSLGIAVAAAILVTGAWLLAGVLKGSPPSEVWLPKDELNEWLDGRISLLENSGTSRSAQYGSGISFTASIKNSGQLYEANARAGLNPATCPNVFDEEKGPLPSGCNKVGSVDGAPVYASSRSLASGVTDAYVVLGGTFIAATRLMVGDDSIDDYFKTFTRYTPQEAEVVLAENRRQAAEHNGAVKIAEDKQKALEAQAYTKLSFTPALPASLPTGWEQGSGRGTVYGDGQPPIPKFIMVGYRNKQGNTKGPAAYYVSLSVGKLSDFSLDSRCGPTIGGGGDYLECSLVPGTDYYEAKVTGRDYLSRYLYRPIGDALVQVSATKCCSLDIRSIPQKELTAQDALVKTLQPTSKEMFKDAKYQPGASVFL